MGIDLTWSDTNGETLDSATDPDGHFAALVERTRENRTFPPMMIRTIDPYGTTRLAPPQLTTLLHELELLRRDVSDPAASITLGHYLSIIRAAEGMPGTWLQFDAD